MRETKGNIIIPYNCPVAKGATILIEALDVSRMDVLSKVIAQTKLTEINFSPGDQIPFALPVPEVPDNLSLSLRIHISVTGSTNVRSGDLLTTQSLPLPSKGPIKQMNVTLKQI